MGEEKGFGLNAQNAEEDVESFINHLKFIFVGNV